MSFTVDILFSFPGTKRFTHGLQFPSNYKVQEQNYLDANTECLDLLAEKKIDDFIDLNEGEKSFFKLWNCHVRSFPGVGLTNMPALVLM